MDTSMSRRTLLKALAAQTLAALPAGAAFRSRKHALASSGCLSGSMTGAQALVRTLVLEGTLCVFGIPGAQENEVWDVMKTEYLDYLLVSHEYSAAAMADGCARSTGRPGVLCIIPGPGVTNALTGLGEALLDSIPLVCIVGDIARGDRCGHFPYRPFQVHDLPGAALLQPVTKKVYEVRHTAEIPLAVRQAFQLAQAGEPGPVAVVIPYPLLLATCKYHSLPLCPADLPWDEDAFRTALALLSDRQLRVGIFAGLGCMAYPDALTRTAELLQAPVATSISGKGVISECHPLAVGYGYGPQGTRTAEQVFKKVDVLLAIGVRCSEVSTGFYSLPNRPHVIQVDINPQNLGRILKAEVCVPADAGFFLDHLLENADQVQRCPDTALVARIRELKCAEQAKNAEIRAKCGVDPMAFLLTLRRLTCEDALVFVDVTVLQYWAAEVFTTFRPRTFFNPVDNQAMGWSIPAALGAQRVHPQRQTVTVTGDGCFLMSAMEISTAAREALPVKFFIIDDQAYHYMQVLQKAAYRRTTATVLARLDYAALAQGWGVAYQEILTNAQLEAGLRGALCQDGPVLTRVAVDYGQRPIRAIEAIKHQFTKELTTEQKVRYAARYGSRMLNISPRND
jgi:acetolactate synthase-1/2/3 large subunit